MAPASCPALSGLDPAPCPPGELPSTPRPITRRLRAKGWVRVVSGVQSLISVYLIAMWVLTYFGRPFE